MSPPISFTPSRPQPFTLEEAMLLEIDTLVAEITRLENSIIHLRSTQSQLLAYLEEEPSGDEDGEIKAAVTENEGVIASQTERITLIKVALLNKVGEGGMRHYGFVRDPDPGLGRGGGGGVGRDGGRRSAPSATAAPTAREVPNPEVEEDQGVYL